MSTLIDQTDEFQAGHAGLLLKQAEEMEYELLSARAVQRFMLPPERQTLGRYDISQMYQPLHHIGGDFVDVLARPDGSVMLMLGDIAGHGVPAAMTFAMLKLAFVRHAPDAAGPADLLNRVQKDLADRLPGGAFVTAMTALLSADATHARVASAGHPNPILLRAGQGTQVKVESSFPLLVAPEIAYEDEAQLTLAPADRLVFLTDGTLEAQGADGQRNSAAALLASLEKHTARTGPAFLQAVYETLFFGDMVFHDDVTLVTVAVS